MSFDDIEPHQPEGEWNKMAPLRVLSFDIECQGRKGHFPEAEKDPVIQIANVLSVYGNDKPIVQVSTNEHLLEHFDNDHVYNHFLCNQNEECVYSKRVSPDRRNSSHNI